MSDDIDTHVQMVERLKWCVETLWWGMQGMWVSPQAGQIGFLLKDLADSFWLAEDVDWYAYMANPGEQATIPREAIRQKLMQIGGDALPQLRNLYVNRCNGVIQILLADIPETVDRDAMGRPVLLDGAARVMKKPVEITVMSNNIVLYLLMAIRANLDPSPQNGSRVSLPSVHPDSRQNTLLGNVVSLLEQLKFLA